MTTKRCRVCGEEKSAAEFHPRVGSPDGLRSDCRACVCARAKKHREQHPERLKEWKANNRERVREHSRRDWQKNGSRRNAARREAYAEDPQPHRDYNRERRQADPESNRERARNWARENAERNRARATAWAKANPSRRADAEHRRRARKKGVPAEMTLSTRLRVKEIKEAESLPCYWCSKPTAPEDRHIDHIIPLSRGGQHIAENLCCACRPCNLAKGSKLPSEFIPPNGAV